MSSAIEKYTNVFSPFILLYFVLVKHLGFWIGMLRLADNLEKQQNLRDTIPKRSSYRSLLLS